LLIYTSSSVTFIPWEHTCFCAVLQQGECAQSYEADMLYDSRSKNKGINSSWLKQPHHYFDGQALKSRPQQLMPLWYHNDMNATAVSSMCSVIYLQLPRPTEKWYDPRPSRLECRWKRVVNQGRARSTVAVIRQPSAWSVIIQHHCDQHELVKCSDDTILNDYLFQLFQTSISTIYYTVWHWYHDMRCIIELLYICVYRTNTSVSARSCYRSTDMYDC